MNKITIIGSGRVGSTIAYSLTCRGLASEIVIIDINGERALGEALDIRQGLAYDSACQVYAGTYEDAKDSNIVVITSGIARKPGQSRLELINTNIAIQKSIIPEITKYAPDAVYIMVSNPVDILTYSFCRLSGIPENRIICHIQIRERSPLRKLYRKIYHVCSRIRISPYIVIFIYHAEFIAFLRQSIRSSKLECKCTLLAIWKLIKEAVSCPFRRNYIPCVRCYGYLEIVNISAACILYGDLEVKCLSGKYLLLHYLVIHHHDLWL